ncbi:hypothetical protein M6B38_331400 [Iris pallida]|uniref:Uncharacterized protein n=1 Tax=Iris pallida TaxID=29817 RepID=A0AAX6EH95_IRIPA|nr:hypothetical protein M6B38_188290 [Iris pallida]KAJ6835660.1 hypothetical protein M6B38_331400 [Iris pallida]
MIEAWSSSLGPDLVAEITASRGGATGSRQQISARDISIFKGRLGN